MKGNLSVSKLQVIHDQVRAEHTYITTHTFIQHLYFEIPNARLSRYTVIRPHGRSIPIPILCTPSETAFQAITTQFE